MNDLGKNIFKAIKKIHIHLTAVEKEYAKKGISKKIRSDWGYAFYTGKLVAYIYILKALKHRPDIKKDLEQRIISLGIDW